MGGFPETIYDKFVFKVKKGYLYNTEDFWAEVQGDVAVVGITDFLQKARGDVAFLETVRKGAEVKQGEEVGTIENIKATFGIISPVTGKVIENNQELDVSPHLTAPGPFI